MLELGSGSLCDDLQISCARYLTLQALFVKLGGLLHLHGGCPSLRSRSSRYDIRNLQLSILLVTAPQHLLIPSRMPCSLMSSRFVCVCTPLVAAGDGGGCEPVPGHAGQPRQRGGGGARAVQRSGRRQDAGAPAHRSGQSLDGPFTLRHQSQPVPISSGQINAMRCCHSAASVSLGRRWVHMPHAGAASRWKRKLTVPQLMGGPLAGLSGTQSSTLRAASCQCCWSHICRSSWPT